MADEITPYNAPISLGGDRGEFTVTRAQLERLEPGALAAFQGSLRTVAVDHPELEVQVLQNDRDGAVTVRWRPWA